MTSRSEKADILCVDWIYLLCLQNGLTPMHLAAQEDKVPVAEILVKYGSQTDTQTKVRYLIDILNYVFAHLSQRMRTT